jgi:hypothetical protein
MRDLGAQASCLPGVALEEAGRMPALPGHVSRITFHSYAYTR